MRIFNEDKTIEFKEEDINYDLGYLKKDILETIIPEQKEIKEEGHYEIIKEYKNGGKDVEWIIDKPGIPAEPERMEKEDILIYILHTKEELKQIEIKNKVNEARAFLSNTDYITNKIVEYQIMGKEVPDYSETMRKREEAREIIREYEEK